MIQKRLDKRDIILDWQHSNRVKIIEDDDYIITDPIAHVVTDVDADLE